MTDIRDRYRNRHVSRRHEYWYFDMAQAIGRALTIARWILEVAELRDFLAGAGAVFQWRSDAVADRFWQVRN